MFFTDRFSKSSRGMTLVEVLAVIVLIGLIMTVVAKGISGKSEAAKARLNGVKMEKLKSVLENYNLEYNTYPEKLDDLLHSSADVKESGKMFVPMADEKELKDIWDQDYIYKTENDRRTFSLTSYGSDKVPGGEGPKQDVTIRP
jgi:general secretion pathway protein G